MKMDLREAMFLWVVDVETGENYKNISSAAEQLSALHVRPSTLDIGTIPVFICSCQVEQEMDFRILAREHCHYIVLCITLYYKVSCIALALPFITLALICLSICPDLALALR
jgi:hypothetical protein